MNRRTLLKALPLGGAMVLAGGLWRSAGVRREIVTPPIDDERPEPPSPAALDPPRDEGSAPGDRPAPDPRKIEDFDRTYDDDVVLPPERLAIVAATVAHLERAQRVIGHGHFSLLSFDRLLRFGRNYASIGRFSRRELDFLEEIFFADAAAYGFFGDKVTPELTAVVPRRRVEKLPGTGNYLLRGESLDTYRQIRRDLGAGIVLTSGIRGVVKQSLLFLAKVLETGGNLSQASRSLAPPGYSYHAVGDFDVGKVGLGADNFTEAFAETDEYKRMIDLGYVEIRYTESNLFGVRHEPWHVKIR
ncbi:MAG: peptidase M15 [Acidobacteria bacterium]|nr:MAG: peptidase M15 [Acidobacteriota bacterium]